MENNRLKITAPDYASPTRNPELFDYLNSSGLLSLKGSVCITKKYPNNITSVVILFDKERISLSTKSINEYKDLLTNNSEITVNFEFTSAGEYYSKPYYEITGLQAS